MSAASDCEILFATHLFDAKISFEQQAALIPGRKWRVDFFIKPDIVVEISGGIWSGGRHTRGQGYLDDCEKWAALVLAGYRVFVMPSDWIMKSMEGLAIVKRALEVRS